MSGLTFTIVDESTLTSPDNGGQLSFGVLNQIAGACEKQLNVDVAAEWGGNYIVRVVTSAAGIQAGEVPVIIRDSLPDAPGAAAYHDRFSGVPIVFAARIAFSNFVSGAAPLSEGLSHELCETAGDASAGIWADRGDGTEEALELCDRLQGTTYAINGVTVANFLFRSAFFPGAAGPYDFLGALKGQTDKTPGGYVILRQSGAQLPNGMLGMHAHADRTVYAHGVIDGVNLIKKAHFTSRSFKRGLRLSI